MRRCPDPRAKKIVDPDPYPTQRGARSHLSLPLCQAEKNVNFMWKVHTEPHTVVVIKCINIIFQKLPHFWRTKPRQKSKKTSNHKYWSCPNSISQKIMSRNMAQKSATSLQNAQYQYDVSWEQFKYPIKFFNLEISFSLHFG